MNKRGYGRLGLLLAFLAMFAWSPLTATAGDKDQAKEKKKLKMETMVVTATRSEEAKGELPQQVDVIGPQEIQETQAADLTDLLKKDSSVDVIQYPGALSGVSIRGFRPEFSGITKHYLLLIDGRPAGTTNLATIPKDIIARVEVLKGPASSLYGGQAMGGVINVITRKSKGKPKGVVTAGYGSFNTYLGSGRIGGNLNERFDFDFSAGLRVQDDNFKMGDGQTRNNTKYKTYNGSLRLGAKLAGDWKAQVMADLWRGRDVYGPGDEFYGDSRPYKKNMDRQTGELSLGGSIGAHGLHFSTFMSRDKYDMFKWNATTPEYNNYSTDIKWWGAQARDTWRFGAHALTFGIDYEKVKQISESYRKTGQRKAPWSPDNQRQTIGYYTEVTLKFLQNRLVLTGGLRYDDIKLETLQTPYKNDFTPGSTNLDSTNPSAGVNYEFLPGWRAHATIGKAFVPPQAGQVAGYAETEVGDVTMILRGNPDLSPEKSWTWDAGVSYAKEAWGLFADLTYFHTKVTDKIERKKVDRVTTTYVNAGDATIEGVEAEASLDVGRSAGWPYSLKLFANAANIIKAEETFGGGGSQDIHNVADWKMNYGVVFSNRTNFDARLSARYRGVMKDTDWVTAGYPELEYPSWTVVDLTANYRPWPQHRITLEVSNLLDKYYYEKKGYSLPGRAFYIKYSFLF